MNETTTHIFAVGTLSPAEAEQLVALLEAEPGVHRAHASIQLSRLAVDADPLTTDQETLLQVVRNTGRDAVPDPS